MTYVIRELEIPDGTVVCSAFVEECIARAPFVGIKYEADTCQVHQLILSSTQGKPWHEWIKPLMKKTNGRIDMSDLRAHYQGEVNTTKRIAEAERLHDSLHYRKAWFKFSFLFITDVADVYSLQIE